MKHRFCLLNILILEGYDGTRVQIQLTLLDLHFHHLLRCLRLHIQFDLLFINIQRDVEHDQLTLGEAITKLNRSKYRPQILQRVLGRFWVLALQLPESLTLHLPERLQLRLTLEDPIIPSMFRMIRRGRDIE